MRLTHSILVTSEATRHLVELRVVEEVGSVSMNQGAEGQAILPASPADKQREPTCQFREPPYQLNSDDVAGEQIEKSFLKSTSSIKHDC